MKVKCQTEISSFSIHSDWWLIQTVSWTMVTPSKRVREQLICTRLPANIFWSIYKFFFLCPMKVKNQEEIAYCIVVYITWGHMDGWTNYKGNQSFIFSNLVFFFFSSGVLFQLVQASRLGSHPIISLWCILSNSSTHTNCSVSGEFNFA